ncbi:MAG TPA: hypothetical protein DCZ94_10925 [Lentisphaeria bacterium]|nr:MAG: hypothetical protein A2X48_06805 [Lentisphaerae bacterium GWF2_49_21]HBC87458.1 hypothetical protein [Lentisphaeria bacterium]
MPLYKYKVAGTDGKTSEILIEGDSQPDSLSRLRNRGLLPLECYGQADALSQDNGWKFWKRDSFDACEFTNRLVPLLKAHIPLERALGIISQGSPAGTSEIVNELRKGLHEGKKFSAIIRDHGNRFPRIYANLVEAGEETGSLPDIMSELQRFLNDRKDLRNFLITSSIYPLFVMAVIFVVIIVLFTVVIPRFSKIFTDMGRELPFLTKMMLGISDIATGFWWLWIICIGVFCYIVYNIRTGGRMADWWEENILKLPLLGELISMIEISRFIRTLAVLIQNHVHLLSTVQIGINVIVNKQIARTFHGVNSELKGGAKLSAALSKSRFVPKDALQMLAIGEESGNMGGMLNQVAANYEDNLKTRIKRLLALFEPVVILFLALIIMLVILSIFMAILEMQNM